MISQSDFIILELTAIKGPSALRPKVWNKLPTNVKSLTTTTKFKEYIKIWIGPSCRYSVCRMVK